MVFMAFGRLRRCAGNVRTVDVGGPYDFSQLSTQVNEIMGALRGLEQAACCAAGRPVVLPT
jgi:hypothetical protein